MYDTSRTLYHKNFKERAGSAGAAVGCVPDWFGLTVRLVLCSDICTGWEGKPNDVSDLDSRRSSLFQLGKRRWVSLLSQVARGEVFAPEIETETGSNSQCMCEV